LVRRGCTIVLVVWGALLALYLWFFTGTFEPPGNLFAAGLGSLFAAIGLGAAWQLVYARRDRKAFRRAERRDAPIHGRLTVVAGRIRALGFPLTSPIAGRQCVAYDYEVTARRQPRKGQAESSRADLAGIALTPCVIEAEHTSVRLLGFPLLDEFPRHQHQGADVIARIRAYASATRFDQMRGAAAFRLVNELDDALADADGAVRKDFRLTEGDIPYAQRQLRERIVEVDQKVCAMGFYDAERRALVPRGAMPNRLWPGTLGAVRKQVLTAARTQAVTGFVLFAISHAMLGGAYYLSETRHAREPEADQASAIRLAVQRNDRAALEQAVRRGANPNARDASGDPVLFDVRDPEMVAAMLRLGADPNVRHRGDNDTLLTRAARAGDVATVKVLLAAGADVHAIGAGGATAFAEAQRRGHDEVLALLRAAGAETGDLPVEQAPVDVERARTGTAGRPTPDRRP
jgi:hypothetical protein